MVFAMGDASGDGLGRLVVIKPRGDLFAQGIMMNNFHALIFCIFSSHVRLVLGLFRIIRSLYPITTEFL